MKIKTFLSIVSVLFLLLGVTNCTHKTWYQELFPTNSFQIQSHNIKLSFDFMAHHQTDKNLKINMEGTDEVIFTILDDCRNLTFDAAKNFTFRNVKLYDITDDIKTQDCDVYMDEDKLLFTVKPFEVVRPGRIMKLYLSFAYVVMPFDSRSGGIVYNYYSIANKNKVYIYSKPNLRQKQRILPPIGIRNEKSTLNITINHGGHSSGFSNGFGVVEHDESKLSATKINIKQHLHPDQLVLAVGPYDIEEARTSNGITVRLITYPALKLFASKTELLNVAIKAFNYMDDYTKTRLIVENVDFISVFDLTDNAATYMTPGAILIDYTLLTTKSNQPKGTFDKIGLYKHIIKGVVRQYFNYSVSKQKLSHRFLTEGLPEYFVRNILNIVKPEWKEITNCLVNIVKPFESVRDNRTNQYDGEYTISTLNAKEYHVMKMVENIIGDSQLTENIHKFLINTDRQLDLDNFEIFITRDTVLENKKFFLNWLEHEGYPIIEVAYHTNELNIRQERHTNFLIPIISHSSKLLWLTNETIVTSDMSYLPVRENGEIYGRVQYSNRSIFKILNERRYHTSTTLKTLLADEWDCFIQPGAKSDHMLFSLKNIVDKTLELGFVGRSNTNIILSFFLTLKEIFKSFSTQKNHFKYNKQFDKYFEHFVANQVDSLTIHFDEKNPDKNYFRAAMITSKIGLGDRKLHTSFNIYAKEMAERCPTHEECEDYVNDVLRLYWDLNKNPSAETTGLIGEGDHVLDMLLKAVDSMGENLADDVLSGIVQYSRSVCNLYWQKPGNENNIDICARMFVDTLLV